MPASDKDKTPLAPPPAEGADAPAAPDAEARATAEARLATLEDQIGRAQAQIAELQARREGVQASAERRAEAADAGEDAAARIPARALDRDHVAKVAAAAALKPEDVFDVKDHGDSLRVITVDARKLDVQKAAL